MRSAHKTTTFGLILCNVLGIHNRRRQSLTGAVHYCSRCGIVTRDNRRHVLQVADTKPFAKGMKIIFGYKGQEFRGLVRSVNHGENKIAPSITMVNVVALPKWRTKLAKMTGDIRWRWIRLLSHLGVR